MTRSIITSIGTMLLIAVLLVSAISIGCGAVTVRISCYNSDSQLSEEIYANHADYSGVTILAPTFISSSGEGKSVDEDFSEFAHRVFAANDGGIETIEARLKAELGDYEWKKEAAVLPDALGMGMSVECGIEDGALEASYRNSHAAHTEEVQARQASYSEATTITPFAILSDGNGAGGAGELGIATNNKEGEDNKADDNGKEADNGDAADSKGEKGCTSDAGSGADKTTSKKDNGDGDKVEGAEDSGEGTDTNSDSSDESGIFHTTAVDGQGKWANVQMNLAGSAENMRYEWEKKVNANTQNAFLGLRLTGGSTDGAVTTLAMDGEASNFPAQHLPPGEVVVTTVTEEIEDEEDDDLFNMTEAAGEFYDEFSEAPTVLYYTIDQECSIPPPGKADSDVMDLTYEEYFNLAMGFTIKP
jgi:hypothetical protein